jgi:hypothetical protein
MLSPAARQRYARHILLAEVGETGQQRLCIAQAQLPADADPRAASIARDYLERAGLSVETRPAAREPQLNREAVGKLAGDPALESAAAALLGALHAVEVIKAELELGQPLALTGVRLSAENGR